MGDGETRQRLNYDVTGTPAQHEEIQKNLAFLGIEATISQLPTQGDYEQTKYVMVDEVRTFACELYGISEEQAAAFTHKLWCRLLAALSGNEVETGLQHIRYPDTYIGDVTARLLASGLDMQALENCVDGIKTRMKTQGNTRRSREYATPKGIGAKSLDFLRKFVDYQRSLPNEPS